MIVEERDRETVELVVRALGDYLVDDFHLGIVAQPPRQDFAELLRSLALVAVKTFAPVNVIVLAPLPLPAVSPPRHH
jgi:hypothetical protein